MLKASYRYNNGHSKISSQSTACRFIENIMTEQTFIKGKDRDLESSISTMQNKLVALDINVDTALLWLVKE